MHGRNWLTFNFYLQVKAGAPMPEDAIVRRNCALIRLVEDRLAAQRLDVPLLLRTLFAGRN